MSRTHRPRALFFDVFGTVVDWRSTVTERLEAAAQEAVASASDSSSASCPSLPLSAAAPLLRHSLETLLGSWQLGDLYSADQITSLSRIWHSLDAWPDSSAGIDALNEAGYLTCTLSNGNVSLLTDMAAHAKLHWTEILSSEHFAAYKPHARVYRGAAARLGLPEADCAMVAAHLVDLQAAKACGLQTVYVQRDREEAWTDEETEKARAEGWVDMWIPFGHQGFLTLARELGRVEAARPVRSSPGPG